MKMERRTLRTVFAAMLVALLAVGASSPASAADPVTTLSITPKITTKCILLVCGSYLETVTYKTSVNKVMGTIRNTNRLDVRNPSTGSPVALVVQYEQTTSNSSINTWTYDAGNANGMFVATLTTRVSSSGYVLSRFYKKNIDVPRLA